MAGLETGWGTFEWDDAKNAANIAKHGVGFELAASIFRRPVLTRTDQRTDYGEKRQVSLGLVDDVLILVVVHTDRQSSRRLISARRASKAERRRYDDALRPRPDSR